MVLTLPGWILLCFPANILSLSALSCRVWFVVLGLPRVILSSLRDRELSMEYGIC